MAKNDEIDPRRELLDTGMQYERVCISYENNAICNNKWIKIQCARPNCTHEQHYMKTCKRTKKLAQCDKGHYDLHFPYFPALLSHIGTLNGRIRNKHIPSNDYTNTNWVEVWDDICNTNS